MKKIIVIVAGVAACAPVCVFGTPPLGLIPDWESADERSTIEIALADFNGDGWQVAKGERKTGDGKRHLFYLKHYPALTITAVRVNGTPVLRADYCFDARAGWFSLKNAPPNGARVEVDYRWSNRLDFFAGNIPTRDKDARDAIYFNSRGKFDKNPGWLSDRPDITTCVSAADYDADGDVDVAIGGCVSGNNFFVKVYENGGAELERTPSWTYVVAGSQVCELAWGDVDNDGYLELAVADMWLDSGRFYVFKNNAGVLEKPAYWSVKRNEASGIAWGDMDGDGDMDLAGTTFKIEQPDGYAYVYRNNGGQLESNHCWRNAPPAGYCTGPAWADFNGDGWLDLVKGVSAGGYTGIYYSNDGVLPTEPSWESGITAYCCLSFAADCDSDRYLDLLQSTGEYVIGYFHRGGDLEKRPSWKYHPGAPFIIFGIAIGDVNGDGYVDVATGCCRGSSDPTGGPNKLFLNKGNIGVNVNNFKAKACEGGVALRWEVAETAAGFNLYRGVKSARVAAEPARINKELIAGRSPYRYLDSDVRNGATYQYWLEVVPLSGPAERRGPAECTVGVKASFALAQNAPNPARTTTTLAFSVPTACEATIAVYDVAGRRVMKAFAGGARAGENELSVDVSSLAPGVYTYRLEAGGAAAAKRMVVVK